MEAEFKDYFNSKVLTAAIQQQAEIGPATSMSTIADSNGLEKFGEEMLTCIQGLPIKEVDKASLIVTIIILLIVRCYLFFVLIPLLISKVLTASSCRECLVSLRL